MSTSTVQQRNAEMVDLLRPDFQARWEPNFAWGNMVSNHLMLPKLRGLWPFSSVDGNGDLVDISGQGRLMTNNNAVPFGVSGLMPYADFTPGTLHYFSRPDETGLEFGASGLTVYCWAWVDALGAAYGLISKWVAAGNLRSWRLYKNAANNLVFDVSGDGAATVTVASAGTLAASAWYHCVGRYNPSTEIAVFLNRVKTTNAVGVPASLFDSSANLEFGRTDGGSYLDGRMSMAAICGYNHSDIICQSIQQQSRAGYNR